MSIIIIIMKKLQELLENDYVDFESLENVEKSSYVLGSDLELWESRFNGLLALVKEYNYCRYLEIQKIYNNYYYMIVTQGPQHS